MGRRRNYITIHNWSLKTSKAILNNTTFRYCSIRGESGESIYHFRLRCKFNVFLTYFFQLLILNIYQKCRYKKILYRATFMKYHGSFTNQEKNQNYSNITQENMDGKLLNVHRLYQIPHKPFSDFLKFTYIFELRM